MDAALPACRSTNRQPAGSIVDIGRTRLAEVSLISRPSFSQLNTGTRHDRGPDICGSPDSHAWTGVEAELTLSHGEGLVRGRAEAGCFVCRQSYQASA